MARTDYLLDDDFDLMEDPVTHDLVEGPSDQQHIEQLIRLNKGELKDSPHVGFGIKSKRKKIFKKQDFISVLAIELAADGYKDAAIHIGTDLSDFTITIPE